jgi:hypothetical protein
LVIAETVALKVPASRSCGAWTEVLGAATGPAAAASELGMGLFRGTQVFYLCA